MPLNQIRAFPDVVQVEYGGDLLRIQTSDIVATLGALMELSKHSAVRLQDIHISQPSLEDVFLQLTGRTIREA